VDRVRLRLTHGTQGNDPAQGASPDRAEHPLDEADIECLIDGLRLVTPCTPRIDRLIDLLEQIRGGGRQDTAEPG
jgi:hypothetical protein